VYLDSAYIAKYYVNEADSANVRSLLAGKPPRISSSVCMVEVCCVFHRHAREGKISLNDAAALAQAFFRHVDSGLWILIPITDRLLRSVAIFVSHTPESVFIRAADALHLTTAQNEGETEIWTNDRHLLAAAPYFGLAGRTV
jgi:predicted nucleic acid-binding protein